VVGLLATEGLPAELADDIADELPEKLSARRPDVEWRVELDRRPPTPRATNESELIRTAHRLRLRQGWDLAICLTDLPLRARRRPVTAYVSHTHRVGVVSVPALGAVAVERRVRDSVLRLVEALIQGRTDDLGSSLGQTEVRGQGTVRFASAAVGRNLRLLFGMVRANAPARVILRLSRALITALGTAAIATANISVWQLADGMTWPRLVVLTLASTVTTVLALILAHGLWERTDDPEAREQIVLFNVTTAVTLTLGVLALSGALFAINAAAGSALIPAGVLEKQLGHGSGVDDYLRLAWLVTTLATIGGALGSIAESDDAVREATYRYQPDETEDE
jgi:hypothetical protein